MAWLINDIVDTYVSEAWVEENIVWPEYDFIISVQG